ncbi:unnamed protein product [Brassica oleracea]
MPILEKLLDRHYIQLDKSTLNIPSSQLHPIFPNHELVRLKICGESILAEQGSRDQVLPHVRHMLHIRQSDLMSRCHLQNHIAASFNLGDCSVSHLELLLSHAFLIGAEHRPIGANVGGCTSVIPPFLGVVAFNHVGFSHHSNEILLLTFPSELLHIRIRIDFNAFVLEVFSRSLQGCNSFGRLGRRMGVCLSFAFVLSHVDTVLLSSDLVSNSVSGFHLKPHDELLEPHLLLLAQQLFHLKEITLGGTSFSGRRMDCSRDGFPQLQNLEFRGLTEWEEWIVEEGSMPLLHTLKIDSCPKLKELPDGLRFITSLKSLDFVDMAKGWEKRLSEGGKDYYKVQHILSVKFNYY